MSGRWHVLRMVVVLGMVVSVSGCWTVRLSESARPEQRITVRVGGPGAREGELVGIARAERTHYTGECVSFGIMPGMSCMANDFGGGWSGYVPACSMCLFVGPFINAFGLGFPTLCTLLVEPFTMTSERRGLRWDAYAMGFVGAYRWRVPAHDEIESEEAEVVLVDGGYSPDTAKIRISESADGTKLWHAYPGFAALMADVKANGKVDVLFSDGDEIRRCFLSKSNPGSLAFQDRPAEK